MQTEIREEDIKLWDTFTLTRKHPFLNQSLGKGDVLTVKHIYKNGYGNRMFNCQTRMGDQHLQFYEIQRILFKLDLVKEKEVKPSEKQVAGSHYSKLKIQPMQYCLENGLNYAQSNVIKYVTRYKDKNGVEDLKKAIHCIELLIEHEEKK